MSDKSRLENNNLTLQNIVNTVTNLPDYIEIKNQDKTININGVYNADSGYTGLGTVTVNVPSGSGDVKLFDTVEHMQADQSPSEGDLAVVYREEVQPMTEESEFSSCIFPNEVVLDEAFSDEIYGGFRAVDPSVMFDGYGEMSSSSFRFEGYGESSEIIIQYESQDGITYTRTDGGEELQEFGTTIKWEGHGDPFNDVISNFMKIGGNYFEGLYEYSTKEDKTKMAFIKNIKLVEGTLQYDSDIYNGLDIGFITEVYNNIQAHFQTVNSWDELTFCRLNDEIYCYVTIVPSKPSLKGVELIESETGSLYIGPSVSYKNYDVYKVTLGETYTYTLLNKTTISGHTTLNGVQQIDDTYELLKVSFYPEITPGRFVCYKYTGGEFDAAMKYGSKCDYAYASSQLNAISDYVYEKTFYGKNGVDIGTLGTTVSTVFNDVSAEIYAKMQNVYDDMTPLVASNDNERAGLSSDIVLVPCKSDGTPLLDTSNVTYMGNMFSGCSNLTTIPNLDTSNVTNMYMMFNRCQNLTSVPNFDTSNVTNMSSMFEGCSNLTSIPLLNTSNVTNMGNMFSYCSNLATIPLLNTSNVTDMRGMFGGCSSLTTIPLLDTSKVTNMISMFYSCSSLNNESLNNILAMCTNAAKITSNKTLKYMRLTEEQANICKTLSNYSAFIAAGWTTGY